MDGPSSPTQSYCSSEESEWIDPAVEKFGNNCLVAAVEDADRVQQLIQEGNAVTANAVQAACFTASAKSLELFLRAGSSPDARLDTAEKQTGDVADGWSSTDITPTIGINKREWFPLQHAAMGSEHAKDDKELRFATMATLLDHKPNLYATFRQPLWHPVPYPFPGEEDIEKKAWYRNHLDRDDEEEPLNDNIDGEYQRRPVAECGYGLRFVLHSLFEDGAFVKPIFEHPDLDIDLERRDPQGRTLLLSACRNAIGADVGTDAIITEATRPLREAPLITPAPFETSLFHKLRKRGADVSAVDHSGKNILHHLLEARTSPGDVFRPPLIRNTLQYIIQHVPALVNQHDNHGTYPLHTALQRLRCYHVLTHKTEESPLEPIVQDLLDGGADPTVLDSRGDTALHYLADNGLAEQWWSEGARSLCAYFCTHGVDVNARNKLGRTALEILMDDSGKIHERRWMLNFSTSGKPPSMEAVDGEILAMFERAGARWTERDNKGRTLLHFVARHATSKAAFRTKYLLAKGVDLGLSDDEGRTVVDVAAQFENKPVLELLGGLGK